MQIDLLLYVALLVANLLFCPVWLFKDRASIPGLGVIQCVILGFSLLVCHFLCKPISAKNEIIALLVTYITATAITNLMGLSL